MKPMGYKRSAMNLAAGLCPSWAITIDVLRAVKPMVIPPASPEMKRPTAERSSSWRALRETCS